MSVVDKNMVRRYWRAVWGRAWREATLGARLMLVILSALGAALVLGLQVFLEDWLFSAIAGIFYFILLLFWAIREVPPKMHGELGGFVEYPIQAKCNPPLPKRGSSPRTASVTFENIAPQVVRNCYVTLDAVYDSEGNDLSRDGVRRLMWSGRSFQSGLRSPGEIQLSKRVPEILDIATSGRKGKSFKFSMWSGKFKLPPGKYSICITPHGEWRYLSIGEPIDLILEYLGENKLRVYPPGAHPPEFPEINDTNMKYEEPSS